MYWLFFWGDSFDTWWHQPTGAGAPFDGKSPTLLEGGSIVRACVFVHASCQLPWRSGMIFVTLSASLWHFLVACGSA